MSTSSPALPMARAGIAAPEAPPARAALAALLLSMLLAALSTSIANVALPTLARRFEAPFHAVQWVLLAYLLAITTLVVGAGRLGDLFGRRRLLMWGLVVFTAGSAAAGLAPTLASLVGARAVQGAGAAVLMSLALAMVADAVPKERVGAAMGLLGTVSAFGTALGPSLGGVLIEAFGWRAVFLVTVPLGGLALQFARRLPADPARVGAQRPPFDGPGMLLLALALGAYALAATWGTALPGAMPALLLGVAVLGLAGFVAVERRSSAPLIRLERLRDPLLRTGLLTSVLVMTVMMSTLVVGPFHLARGLGLDAAAVGLAVAVGPLVAALAGMPAGRLVDRLGAPAVVRLGLALMGTGTLAVAAMPHSLGVPGYVAPLAVLTSGFALFQAANNTALMAGVAASERGVVSGLLNLSRNLGLVTGAAVMGAVFAGAVQAPDLASASPAAVAAGMRFTFGVASVLVVLALLATLAGSTRSAAART